jgi:hypothetical protein
VESGRLERMEYRVGSMFSGTLIYHNMRMITDLEHVVIGIMTRQLCFWPDDDSIGYGE